MCDLFVSVVLAPLDNPIIFTGLVHELNVVHDDDIVKLVGDLALADQVVLLGPHLRWRHRWCHELGLGRLWHLWGTPGPLAVSLRVHWDGFITEWSTANTWLLWESQVYWPVVRLQVALLVLETSGLLLWEPILTGNVDWKCVLVSLEVARRRQHFLRKIQIYSLHGFYLL